MSAAPPPSTSRWIQRPCVRAHARVRLFCVPHAGGTADLFSGWARVADPAIELALIQLPGRAGRLREPRITSMQGMVDRLGEALAPFLDLPFAFFGHSMGALIAFELARRLEGHMPERLFLSACPAPQRARRGPRVGAMNDEQLIAFLSALGGTPPAVLKNSELLKLVVPFVRSDFELVEAYEFRPGPRLKTPFSICFGSTDPETEPNDIACWGNLTEAGYEARVFAGNHFFLTTATTELVAWISAALLQRPPPMPYKEF